MKRRASTPLDSPIDSAESQLAAAVILRALTDASMTGDENGHSDTNLEKAQAIRFLTARTGEWATSRKFWCGLAGINADAMVDRLSSTLQPLASTDATDAIDAA